MVEAESGSGRRGRPIRQSAESHAAIMDAVYELLQTRPARDLTMDAVAKQAKVGRPTLYKWWPSKAELIFAMFHERIVRGVNIPDGLVAEETIRRKVRYLIGQFNGLFGKVMADLIAEGQSEPKILEELYEQHMKERFFATVADVERGKANGEFRGDVDSEMLVSAIIGPIYFRFLLKHAPLTEEFGEELVDQVLRGARA